MDHASPALGDGGSWASGDMLSDGQESGTAAPRRTLGRLGALEVRLACNTAEVRRAQRLRYRVFFKEGCAAAGVAARLAQRDIDAFDRFCDHLLVIDHAAAGTYRLLRQEVAERHRGFYSAGEFAVGDLIARHGGLRFLELGRSCVLAPYRNKRTLELLWHGIAGYADLARPDVMIGCASLEGTDPDRLALPLSYLHHFAGAPAEWRAAALADRRSRPTAAGRRIARSGC